MRYRHPLDKIVLLLATTLIFACFSSEANAATFVVNSTADAQDVAPGDGICQTSTLGQCTLRAAITEANALPGDDTINLSSGTFLITLMPAGEDNNAGGDFDIRSNITINGTGSTVIQAAGTGGVGVDRVFHFVTPGISASVNNVNIRNGRAPSGATGGAVLIEQDTVVLLDRVNVSNHQADSGGAISNHGALTLTGSTINNAFAFASSGDGGGVLNSGTMTVSASTIRNNEATRAGGGLHNTGSLALADSTVSNNSAFASTSNTQGGGIYNSGTTSIATSTLSGNSAATEFGSPTDGQGGGIFNSAGTITISGSTLSGNGATGQAGAIYSSGPATLTSTTVTGAGAGIYNVSSLDLKNTIIAGGCPAGGGTVNAEYSLIQSGLGCVNGTNLHNRTGDPLLGPLADNGGLTMTHALLANSPAIDKGNSYGSLTDQRGLIRPVDNIWIPNAADGSDMGAYEREPPPPPVTFTVNSTADLQDASPGNGVCQTITPGVCTLRAAITEANALAGGNIIILPAGIYQITLNAADEDANAGGDFDISSAVIINGAGAGSTFIQAASSAGTATERVLHTYSGQLVVIINDVTIRYGNRPSSGGEYYGTGILNHGSVLALNNTVVTNNSGIFGGGIANRFSTMTLDNTWVDSNSSGFGAGVFNDFGTLTATRSTISNNTAFSSGGGLWNSGPLNVRNSTVSGNSAVHGGGIYNVANTLTLISSTVTNNTASGVFSRGGGIRNDANAAISNSIIAGNGHPTSPDVYGSFNSQGYNLIGIADGSSGFNAMGDQAGTSSGPIDPMLGPLQNNGGITKTHKPRHESPAIDKGYSFAMASDQRGIVRPVDIISIPNAADGADIGAVELMPWVTHAVNSPEDVQDSLPGDGICQTSSPGVCTLRAAITEANALGGDHVIDVPPGIYQITLTGTPENANAAGDFDINSSITINGAGADSTIVQGAAGPGIASERVFQFISGISSLNNISVRYGRATVGGGIYNSSVLELNRSKVSDNSSSSDGGGIYNNTGTLTIFGSTVSRNSSSNIGGGLVTTNGSLSLSRSMVSNNSALAGAGLYSFQTGAISMVNIDNSLITQNTATNLSGGLYNGGTMLLTNSTVSGNSATQVGGIYNPGTLTMTSSTVTNNTAVEYGGIYGLVDVRPAIVRNSIIAGNNSPLSPDVYGSYNSQGYNLVGAGDGATGFTEAGDQVGTAGAPMNALLSPLQNNGGPTMTHALLAGSPAIDKGNSFGLLTDQRGSPRPVDVGSIPNAADGADIGAFEVQAPTAAGVTVSGRVLTSSGVGIARSHVILTDMEGQTRTVRTNTFGYYRFDSVPAGGTYIVSVIARGYSFTDRVIEVMDEISDMTFIANEIGTSRD